MSFKVGDHVKVIDQNITGSVVFADDWHIVIEDDEAEFEDNRLEYRASDLELCELYFCLDGITGNLHNLGYHVDYNSADAYCEDNKLHPVWIIGEYTARQWQAYLYESLKTA
jgi:hypothetical protein